MQTSLGRFGIDKLGPKNPIRKLLGSVGNRQAAEKRKPGRPCKEVDPALTADLLQRQQDHEDKQQQQQSSRETVNSRIRDRSLATNASFP